MAAGLPRKFFFALLAAVFLLARGEPGTAQNDGYQREFQKPKIAVDAALKKVQAAASGKLPVLDGFATADQPLDRYRRAYYQTSVRVTAAGNGASLVRVASKITAWYEGPGGTGSGYRLLTSNGRLENDFLDQLADQLGASTGNAAPAESSAVPVQPAPAQEPTTKPDEPAISAPSPQLPDLGSTPSSSMRQGLAGLGSADTLAASPPNNLEQEARTLEEVWKRQAHPNNLVAVRKAGTPVVSGPSLTAKTLFLASAHDEFEILDFNADWVHVRISGLSRGWIWRNSVEMPNSVPDSGAASVQAPLPAAAELYRVTRNETATFPGDWEPLRGKSVEIVSVQKVDESAPDGGTRVKLEYAKFLLNKSYADLAPKAKDVAGIVLIFDAVDGGMIAAAMPTLQQWKAGKLTDAALWHQCFFDPPENLSEP